MIRQVLGTVGIVFVGALLLLNAVVMAVSPKKWFAMPRWLAGHASLTRDRYSAGAGALQVRALGVAFAVAILWACCERL